MEQSVNGNTDTEETVRIKPRHWIGVAIGMLLWLLPMAMSMLDPNQEPIRMAKGSTLLDVPGIYAAFALTVAMGSALGLGMGVWAHDDNLSDWTRRTREGSVIAGTSYALVHYIPFALQFVPMLVGEMQHAARPVYFGLILYGWGTGTLTELLFAVLAALGGALGALSQYYLWRSKSAIG